MSPALRLTGRQHDALRLHLFPGDGLEAVSVGLCGRHRADSAHILTLHDIWHVPHDRCTRAHDRVTWSTDGIEPFLERAMAQDLAIVKFHSHPGGLAAFSHTDNRADADLLGSNHGWTDGTDPHGSVIMLPEGRLIGRLVSTDGATRPLGRIMVAGDDIRIFDAAGDDLVASPSFDRQVRLFGEATNALLGRLAVGVVGCSGTGGPVVEQLARLGVGCMVLVDPDRVGDENLTRIPNTTLEDARKTRYKVEVMARAIAAMGFGTTVQAIPDNLADSPSAVRALAGVDVIIGCVDSIEGRHIANRVATFYNLPYLDVGVKLIADGSGSIHQVCGTVHYVQPDGPSLLDRGVYTAERLRAEATRRSDPENYNKLRESGYIDGVDEPRPAVVSVNTYFASLLVNELLARLHPYRLDANERYAVIRQSLTQMQAYYESESDHTGRTFRKCVGRGDTRPLLGMPSLTEPLEVHA